MIRFAFNVPAGFLDDGDSHGSRERYPSLLSEMRAIADRDYGWAPDDEAPGRVRQRLTRQCHERARAPSRDLNAPVNDNPEVRDQIQPDP